MNKLFKIITILSLTILLCMNTNISNATETKDIDYTETLETFDNPERGYYSYLYYNFKVTGNEEPSKYLDGNLVHLRLGIGDFSKKVNGNQDLELSEDMLNMLDTILKKIKSNGGTAIVRFAYDNFDGDEDLEPSLEMILKHIKQICPVLTENKDAISYIELGFFGPWGEMHSSEICEPENVSQALTVMLENTPEELKIGVRQPKYYVNWAGVDREKLNENITVKGTPAYRVGLFNDGYLGSHSDLGTFENREIEIQWLENQALHTLYGGEVVSTRTSGGNEDIDTINTAEYMSKEAFRTHTTYLNYDYDKKVINAWKDEIYNGEDELYKGQTGYLYITNHLGYRFVLRNSDIKTNIENKKLNVNLGIENVGFANLVNSKKVTLVLKNATKTYEIPTNMDPTTWNSTKLTNINAEIDLPENMEEGEWDAYLRISKYGDLKTDNNYQCIRLANNNIWNETLCANYIGNFLLEKQNTSDEPSDEPEIPDINTTPDDEPEAPDVNTTPDNEPQNPDVNTTPDDKPETPDVNTNPSDKPENPDVNIIPNDEPKNPNINTISNNNFKIDTLPNIALAPTTKKTILPYAGIKQNPIILVMIGLSVISIIYFYKKLK